MSERERERSAPPAANALPADEPPPTPDDAERVIDEADRLMRAADDAIAQALSGDSEAFLRAARQASGQ